MRGAIAVIVVVCAAPGPDGHAEPAPRPWQVGVTDDAKAAAQRRLDEGNALYGQDRFKEALAAYELGLAAWDHPAIRFNVARTLIALDRTLDALEQLERAMAHGPEALAEVWSEAVNYRSLLARQIATLTVTCDQAGVAVSLDGDLLPPCPATTTRRLVPGRHAVIARKDGFLSISREPTLVGGDAQRVELSLVSVEDAAVTRTRWATWKPWAVVGAAAVVGGAGAALELDARATLDRYRGALADECGERGCASGTPSAAAAELERSAQLRDRVGVGLMIAGGVGLAAGVGLLIANRPYSTIPDDRRPELSLAPMIGPGALGVVVTARR